MALDILFVTDTLTLAVQAAAVAAEEGAKSKSLLEDTNLWVLIGFLIVVGIAVSQGVPGMINKALGARATGVRNQLDEARSTREEAQRLLADYQKRQREAEDEAKAIIDQAKADAKALKADALAAASEQKTRRLSAVKDRIARAEAQAIAEFKGKTTDLAVAAAREIIGERVDEKAQAALLDRSINDLRGHLN